MEGMDNQTLICLIYAGVLLLVGLAMGSFLNVVAYRLPLGMSLLHPPSTCPSCATAISARDNLPLLGWLLLRRKCRNCRRPISARYPLVELATGLLWAAEGWRLAGMSHGFSGNIAAGLLELAFVSSLVVTFLVDWDHKIILDEISVGGLAISLLAAPFLPFLHHADDGAAFALYNPFLNVFLEHSPAWAKSLAVSLAGALFGLLFSLFIYVLGNFAFKRQIEAARKDDPEVDSALGLGDVKLMAFFGAFLGWQGVLMIFVVGSLTGAFFGTIVKLAGGDSGGAKGWAGLRNRWLSGDSVIPFGPFLAVGALAVFFLDLPLSQLAEHWVIFP